MTEATTIASWAAKDTTLADVERALTEVRRAELRAAVRTAVLTLVVLADQDDCRGYLETIERMAAAHPSHALILVTGDASAPARVDADVQVHALERDGRSVCFEDVVLRLRGPVLRHLDSVIEPFAIADLPVVVWVPGRLPPLDDPLLRAADRVVVDSRALRHATALADVALLSRRMPVTDLSWIRLAPWRELLGGLFEGAAFRPFVHRVTSARVSGKETPALLTAGWLQTRLDLAPERVRIERAEHVSIDLHCDHDGRSGRFAVRRPTSERLIEAVVDIDGGPSHTRTLRMRDRSPSRVLGQALARVTRDHVYDEALAAAVERAATAS